MKKIVFYEYLDIWHLLVVALKLEQYRVVYFFTISKPAGFLLNILGLDDQIRVFSYSLEKIRDINNKSLRKKIFHQDVISLCDISREEIFKNNHFLIDLGKLFDHEKILFYFWKRSEIRLRDMAIYLNVIEWFSRQGQSADIKNTVFFIHRNYFSDIVLNFAKKNFSFKCVSYLTFRKVLGYVYYSIGPFFRAVVRTFFAAGKLLLHTYRRKPIVVSKGLPMVGVPYEGIGISFDPTKRCEFPWAYYSHVPLKQVLIYCTKETNVINDDELATLLSKEIQIVSLVKSPTISAKVPLFVNSLLYTKMMLFYLCRLLFFSIRELCAFRFGFISFMEDALCFVDLYCHASDLYDMYNIKTEIGHSPFCDVIPKQLALARQGGVSLSYQINAWSEPGIFISSCADVKFLFGPYFYPMYMESGSINKEVVYTGYVTDYSFDASKKNAEQLRNRLKQKGASFIICYLDENSSSDLPWFFISNESNVNIYSKLLDLIIYDESLGLICSPKKPQTLFKRLSGLESLVQRAIDTGRCCFRAGKSRTYSYPTEAVQASDIAVSLRIGETVTLESQMSGVRTVVLDLENKGSASDLLGADRENLFSNIDELILAIRGHRLRDAKKETLGMVKNAKELLGRKDPYQDGRASERIASYIGWLLEGFGRNMAREEVLKDAIRKYATKWDPKSAVISS